MPHAIHIDFFLVLCFVFVVLRFGSGDYSRREVFWESARSTTRALLITGLPDLVLMLLNISLYSPLVIIGTWVFLMFAIPLYRQGARMLLQRLGAWVVPSAMIGDVTKATQINHLFDTSLSLGLKLCKIIALERLANSESLPAGLDIVVAGSVEEACRCVVESGCQHAVISSSDMSSANLAGLTSSLLEYNISVAIVPSLQRLPLSGLAIDQFFGKDVLLLQIRDSSREVSRRIMKRACDLFGALFFAVIFSPVLAAIAVAVKAFDGGPIFYGHTRVGLGGKSFRCLKFRTMAVDADARLARWKDEQPALYEEFLKTHKLRDDPRVTSAGKWLRRTSLDELPQLFNVLLGDMSLVGPRPVVQKELMEYYGTAAQLYVRVRPGMTGLWQVSGRSDTTYAERVTYDELYVLNWSLWYDLVILIQTAWTVIAGKGAF